MSLIAQIKADVAQITSNGNEFGVPLTFTPPLGSPVTVNGLATKHHLEVNREGVAFNGMNGHCSAAESVLTAAGYTVRNGNNKVSMVGHLVAWTDASGELTTYKIAEVYPDETLGLLVFILSNYSA